MDRLNMACLLPLINDPFDKQHEYLIPAALFAHSGKGHLIALKAMAR